MPSKTNPTDVLNDTANILRVWAANTDFKMKDITLAGLEADAETLRGLLPEIADKEAELTPLRNHRDELVAKLSTINGRARAGFKGCYGGDSDQYELAGGTRSSERKRSRARVEPALPKAA